MTLGPRAWSSYHVFGAVGAAAGLALVSWLVLETRARATTWSVLALVPLASLFGSFALARAGWWRGSIVFYEKAVIAIAATGIVLAALGEPVRAGLDLATLGIGAMMVFGRAGCFSVACCHGRRARWGVRYGWGHAAIGYPMRWVGMTVAPVQLADGAASALAVGVGIWLVLTPHAAGEPLAAYACTYGLARFVFEWFRGDTARRYLAGASEAQWFVAATVLAATLAAPRTWTVAALAAVAAALGVLAIARRGGVPLRIWLLSASHLAELDTVLGQLVAGGAPQVTAEGVRVAFALVPADIYALRLDVTHRRGPLAPRLVAALGRQLGRHWTVIGQPAPGSLVLVARPSPDAAPMT